MRLLYINFRNLNSFFIVDLPMVGFKSILCVLNQTSLSLTRVDVGVLYAVMQIISQN